eukprot:CAMPEP_0114538608 /NCGR_PEP_ID=MMETSP0109-20121206/30235_1 /TAXON_ID=29199 /ORGANISM="Chlorarachnion reptans, Strain CCCM449" /LENGTH=98 /DNA_ID=CAMNT_0001722641 /DNA_START=349 /DNA_END=645 /DNA_ORIENTATION=-
MHDEGGQPVSANRGAGDIGGSPQQHPKDCMACRVTGTVTLAGMSAYLLYQRMQVERSAIGHRRLLAVMGGSLAVLSGLRGLGFTFGAEKAFPASHNHI